MDTLQWDETLLRLGVAAFFGALIGIERERKHWTAGLRTHMMVSVGSCLAMIVSAYGFHDVLVEGHITLDPSRVAAQVISGIGFIGAGTILFLKQGVIRGLTTAAGLWTVAAIGLATGGGLFFAAGVTTVIALLILWGLQPLEQLYFKKFRDMTLKIIALSSIGHTELLKNLLVKKEIRIKNFSMERDGDEFVLLVNFERVSITDIDSIVNELKEYPDVKEIFWTH